MKPVILAGVTLALLGVSNRVIARNIVNLPFRCSGIWSEGKTINSKIVVSERAATIEDAGDRAALTCKEIATGFEDNVLVCNGTWESDGSQAELSVSLSNFAPLPSFKRSQSTFGGEVVGGLCLK